MGTVELTGLEMMFRMACGGWQGYQNNSSELHNHHVLLHTQLKWVGVLGEGLNGIEGTALGRAEWKGHAWTIQEGSPLGLTAF